MKNFTVVNKGTNGKAVMMLTGMVSFYNGEQSFSASKFINDFNKLKETHNEIHIDIVNLYGGSITEGIPVYNHLKETAEEGKVKITGKIDGLAASMGSIIAMAIPVENLEMGNMARIMNHRAKGGAYGTADDVEHQASTIRSYEDDLVDILAERTGLSTKDVRAKWMDGRDHYIKAEEALTLKLVGHTTKSKAIKKAPKNSATPEEVFNFYQQQIVNAIETDSEFIQNQNEDMKLIAQFIAAFALAGIEMNAENASEETILAQVKKVTADNKDLKGKLETAENQLTAQKDLAVANLVATALKDGKIQKSQEASLKKMAENSLEDAQEFVKNQTVHKPLTTQLNNGQNAGAENNGGEEKDFNWYRKNDSKGLMEMKTKQPDEYQALLQAHLEKSK
ncbi:MAG: hypothetical protein CL528_11355 [Aequorivita sp.]|nr:hypothetical protein [Aequorivita sp.]MBP42363.1 hypothetical protein [Aequorivita sp.]|tara:strand:- start:11567 stop:12748 length:1182 start_codon:yes stop_codon:yes gene_type:complete